MIVGASDAALRQPKGSSESAAAGTVAGVSRRALVLGERWEAVLAAATANKATEISLVGSTARGADTPDSDVDFLVRFAPGASLFDQARLQGVLEDLLGCRVDVISVGGLSAERAARIAVAEPVNDADRDADRLRGIDEDVGFPRNQASRIRKARGAPGSGLPRGVRGRVV